jgi:plasmid stabilization system protein ParE
MPVELKWLDQANDDLQSILDYISSENPRAAASYVDAIVQSCERLSFFPEAGRAYNSRYRVLVIRNHLALYRYDPVAREVTIAAVIDSRRDVETIVGGL